MAGPLLIVKAFRAKKKAEKKKAETVAEAMQLAADGASKIKVHFSGMSLEWNGRVIVERVRTAVEEAVQELLEDCVSRAQADHGWESQTGTAEASIQVGEVVAEAGGVRGQWGSYGSDAAYFVWLEAGSSSIPADDTLRRAADALYPELASRIASKLGG